MGGETGGLDISYEYARDPRNLRPLVSMWLDFLILRLTAQTEILPRAAWVIADEVATLENLPNLPMALAESRKSNTRMVLGLQGRSQVEMRYGREAEAMLSQPRTKIFLRTSEPRAAEWISKCIGDVEIEHLREGRTSVSLASTNQRMRVSITASRRRSSLRRSVTLRILTAIFRRRDSPSG